MIGAGWAALLRSRRTIKGTPLRWGWLASIPALMVTHSMHQALSYGDRLLMLHEGRICLDLAGEEKARLTVPDLLSNFRRQRGEEIDDDALLLD